MCRLPVGKSHIRIKAGPRRASEEPANRREVSSGDSSCVGGSWTHRGVCRPRPANRLLQAFRAQPKRGAAAPSLPTDARCSCTSSSKSTFQGGGKSRPAKLAWPPPPYLRGRRPTPETKQQQQCIRITYEYIHLYTLCINTLKYACASAIEQVDPLRVDLKYLPHGGSTFRVPRGYGNSQ